MLRALTLLLLVLLMVLLATPVTSEAVAVAEMLPAPAGYSFTFNEPVSIVGYKAWGRYYPYTTNGGNVIIFDTPNVETLVTTEGTVSLRIIKIEELYKAYGIVLSEKNSPESIKDLVIYGAGIVYISRYKIYYEIVPQNETDIDNVVLVTSGYLDLRTPAGIYLVSITSPGLVVYKKDGSSIETTLTDYLGVSDACIVWFRNLPPGVPWVGGIIPSPACTENIEILKYFEVEGQVFGVIFKTKEATFVFGPPTGRVLEAAGYVMPLNIVSSNKESKVHILAVDTLGEYNVYLARDPASYLELQPKVTAIDVTMVTREGEYVCNLPRKYTLLYRLLWVNRELKGQVKLMPGEIILYTYDNNVYICRGDLSWLFTPTYPSIDAPKYKEIKHPIRFTGYNGNFLVVLSNGEVYVGPSVAVDYDKYLSNVLYVVYGNNMLQYIYTPTSIVTSPLFALTIIVALAMIGLLLQRKPEEREVVTIEWDIIEPPKYNVATKEELRRAITKNIDNWGTCPDEHELIMRYGILPPLEAVSDPRETVVYCPFKTNIETEIILKKVAKLLLSGFWGVSRQGRSHGYIFSFIREQMLYMYWYKQEDEDHPAEVLFNALKRAMRTYIVTGMHTIPLGLLIIAKDDMRRRLERELERVKRMTPEGTPGYSFEQYFSIHLPHVDVNLSALQEFVSKNIPAIIVVSDKNLPVLVEFLAGRYASLMEEYIRVYGRFWWGETTI